MWLISTVVEHVYGSLVLGSHGKANPSFRWSHISGRVTVLPWSCEWWLSIFSIWDSHRVPLLGILVTTSHSYSEFSNHITSYCLPPLLFPKRPFRLNILRTFSETSIVYYITYIRHSRPVDILDFQWICQREISILYYGPLLANILK